MISEQFSIGPSSSITSHFIVLDLLRTANQTGVHDGLFRVLAHQLLDLFDESFHSLAMLSLGADAQILEDRFQSFDVRFRLLEMLDDGAPAPAAVIGLPVGFVGALESKEALASCGRVPFLIVRGRKGGSAMAVAAVNALASEQE